MGVSVLISEFYLPVLQMGDPNPASDVPVDGRDPYRTRGQNMYGRMVPQAFITESRLTLHAFAFPNPHAGYLYDFALGNWAYSAEVQ